MYQLTTSNHRGPGLFWICSFGKVIQGYEVIELIKSVETKPLNGHRDVPIELLSLKMFPSENRYVIL